MLEKLFIGSFGKIMIAALMLLVTTNMIACYQKKEAQRELITAKQEIALVRSDNQNLMNQLENTQLQIKQYQQQIKDLHNKIVHKLQQAEQRNEQIQQSLLQHQNWANQPVPTNLSQLLNQRNQNHNKTDRTSVPK